MKEGNTVRMNTTAEFSNRAIESCGKCAGSGWLDCDQECTVCMGEGKVFCKEAEALTTEKGTENEGIRNQSQ